MNHEVNYDLTEELRDILYEGFYNWKFNNETVDGYIDYVSKKNSDFSKLQSHEIKKTYLKHSFELLSENMGMFSRGLADIAERIVCSITFEDLEEGYEPPYNPMTETDIDLFADLNDSKNDR